MLLFILFFGSYFLNIMVLLICGLLVYGVSLRLFRGFRDQPRQY
jgi:hypothetical protein